GTQPGDQNRLDAQRGLEALDVTVFAGPGHDDLTPERDERQEIDVEESGGDVAQVRNDINLAVVQLAEVQEHVLFCLPARSNQSPAEVVRRSTPGHLRSGIPASAAARQRSPSDCRLRLLPKGAPRTIQVTSTEFP